MSDFNTMTVWFPLNNSFFLLWMKLNYLLAVKSSDQMVRSFPDACFAKCLVPTYVPTFLFLSFFNQFISCK